ncbi:MAG TPA: hypothetical protein PKZ84_20735 [Anaerolineae bacterium]|nr:hypothetical protein [Anaerolineae bacterium]HQI87038.1 hypothetical protein [Anaerolineae bacterium]
MPITIAKLLKSTTHTDYVAQIYGSGEIADPPAPTDYAFGTFVRVPLGGNYGHLVGVIYDTMLLNPDFGNLGPRLSPAPDLAVFSPDYLAEKVTLVGIMAVGMVNATGHATQGVPPFAAAIDALVERMDDVQVRAFHRGNPALHLAYAPLLLRQGSPLILPLLEAIIGRLTALFPEHAALLAVVQDDLKWKAQIVPLGGAQ